MRITFRGKLLALFLGIFTLSFLLLTFFFYRTGREAMKREFLIRGRELARTISLQALSFYEKRDLQGFVSLLGNFAESEAVLAVLAYGPGGEIWVESSAVDLTEEERALKSRWEGGKAEGTIGSRDFTTMQGELVSEFIVPVLTATQTPEGWVRVMLNRAPLEEALRALLRKFLIGSALLMGAMGWLLVRSLRHFLKPIDRLARTIRYVSTRHIYSARVESYTRDEIGQLIDDFNGMLAQIQARDSALEKAQDELEERVYQRTEALQHLNRELEQFAYVASHDLQEPLRKILAFGGRLKQESSESLSEASRDYLERMLKSARRMGQLMTDLLALSRVTTGAKPFGKVSLREVLEGVIGDLEVRILESGGRVDYGELPPVHGDRVQISQLFQNLVANALKFSRKGVSPVVTIESRPAGDFVEISVCDNGIGFDEKYLDRIFKPFQRLYGRDEYEGSGMGLAICEKIVQRHGGTITAKSEPGKGSCFIISLPRYIMQPGV